MRFASSVITSSRVFTLPTRPAKWPRTKTWTLWRFPPRPRRPYAASSTTRNFKYEQKKKTRELKAKQTKVVLKEIRFGPNTDDHDFEFKLKHAQEF